VGSNKTRRLEMTVATIQRRWGLTALRRLESSPPAAPIPHVPTSFPALDKALGVGGIPRGKVTEILGYPTSGMSTLALKIVANAQSAGDRAAYIDLGTTFDPDYAVRCGIRLDGLLLVRPANGGEALEIACALIAERAAGVLVFDSASHLRLESHVRRSMSTLMRRLAGGLAGSICAPLFLTQLRLEEVASAGDDYSGLNLPHHAAVRLLIEKEHWLQKRRDVVGYRAKVSVLKNTFGPPGRQVEIEINFHGVVLGNGT
jgi:recombination protein RecA